jgi:hypothetical protein
MKLQIQLKTRNELLRMGYEPNDDPKDFLNLLSGKIVTLSLNKTIATKDGTIYVSTEYPKYAIYDYLIKRVITQKSIQKDEYEYSLKEIGDYIGTSYQNVSKLLKKLFTKENKNSLYAYAKKQNINFDY